MKNICMHTYIHIFFLPFPWLSTGRCCGERNQAMGPGWLLGPAAEKIILFFIFCNLLTNLSCTFLCRVFSTMSSSGLRNDDGVPPLYRQGGSLSKVGYFKDAHFKINYDDSFRDFLETYWHAIPSGVRVRRLKDGSSYEPCDEVRRAIKFHPYYFVLGFTFPMPRFFQEVLCFMRCAPAQCSPNVV